MLRPCFSLLLLSMLVPSLSSAQTSRAVCWRGRPQPRCAVVLLTNAGGYLTAGRNHRVVVDPVTGLPSDSAEGVRVGPRAVADWGVLFNVGRRDALGASFAASLEDVGHNDRAFLALFLRYRRWIRDDQSLDLALGLPVLQDGDAVTSPLGLVKWNYRWIGVAVRPELRRSVDYYTTPPSRRSDLFTSLGIELGERPGFVTSLLGGAVTFVALLVALASSD